MQNTHPPIHRPSKLAFLLVPVLALAVVAAACGDVGSGGGASGGGDEMSIEVVTPSDGSSVGESFEVQVAPSVEIGETDTGLHHVHLYYDGETAEGEYDILYDDTFTVDRLDPGEHVIEAVIANADHSTTDASDEITVQVGMGAGSGPDEPTNDAPIPDGY